jgi:hypothetical protein
MTSCHAPLRRRRRGRGGKRQPTTQDVVAPRLPPPGTTRPPRVLLWALQTIALSTSISIVMLLPVVPTGDQPFPATYLATPNFLDRLRDERSNQSKYSGDTASHMQLLPVAVYPANFVGAFLQAGSTHSESFTNQAILGDQHLTDYANLGSNAFDAPRGSPTNIVKTRHQPHRNNREFRPLPHDRRIPVPPDAEQGCGAPRRGAPRGEVNRGIASSGGGNRRPSQP